MSSAALTTADITRPGAVVAGKYRVEDVIGRGGMGLVLRATHLDLGQPVAIKVVRAELAADEIVIERMLMEARSAAQIRSEHVARVLDVSRLDDGSPYLVMEYLEGEDLSELLERNGRVPPAEAVSVIVQACHALAEAHRAGIVHRDLKPENLFLASQPDGTQIIKVLDFGISKQVSGAPARRSLTQSGTLIGSPHYMAPEQLEVGDELDGRTDVWALGIILFEMLTGRPPFDGDTVQDICLSVLMREPPPIDEDIPPEIAMALARCLSKDPDERFDGVADLALAIAPTGGAEATKIAERAARVAAGRRVTPPRSVRTDAFAPPTASSAPSLDAVVRGRHDADTRVVRRSSTLWRALPLVALVATIAGVAIGLGGSAPDSEVSVAAPGTRPPTEPTAGRADSRAVDRTARQTERSASSASEAPGAGHATAAPGRSTTRRVDPASEPSAVTTASGERTATRPAKRATRAAPRPRPRKEPSMTDDTPKTSAQTAPSMGDAWDPSTFGGRQ